MLNLLNCETVVNKDFYLCFISELVVAIVLNILELLKLTVMLC